ncbi:MAG: malonate decarboxylase acyl carrier protein [Solidesulfovibrio sp. DCME]|uniref:malonate decarboxylase acyl carrier protein n=1 Tax=Solidesulfovibrio sp. DCME TaxID=3447380 RepID=UPI003D0EE247
MEHLEYELPGRPGTTPARDWALVGVVTSSNLEVLVEKAALGGKCRFVVDTSAKGFGPIWQAVIEDFLAKHPAGDLLFSIHDNGAPPAVVALRLAQALDAMDG